MKMFDIFCEKVTKFQNVQLIHKKDPVVECKTFYFYSARPFMHFQYCVGEIFWNLLEGPNQD